MIIVQMANKGRSKAELATRSHLSKHMSVWPWGRIGNLDRRYELGGLERDLFDAREDLQEGKCTGASGRDGVDESVVNGERRKRVACRRSVGDVASIQAFTR